MKSNTNGASPLSNVSNLKLDSLEKTLGKTSGSRTYGAGLAMGVSHSHVHNNGSGSRVRDRSGGDVAGKHGQADAHSIEEGIPQEAAVTDEEEASDSESVPSFSRSRSSSDSSTSSESSLSISPVPGRGDHECQIHFDFQAYPEADRYHANFDEESSAYACSTTSFGSSTPLLASSSVKRKSMLAGLFNSKRKSHVPAPIKTAEDRKHPVRSEKSQSPRSPLFDWKFKNHYAVRNVRAGQTGMNRRNLVYGL